MTCRKLTTKIIMGTDNVFTSSFNISHINYFIFQKILFKFAYRFTIYNVYIYILKFNSHHKKKITFGVYTTGFRTINLNNKSNCLKKDIVRSSIDKIPLIEYLMCLNKLIKLSNTFYQIFNNPKYLN